MKRAVALAVVVSVGLAFAVQAAEEGTRALLSRSFTVDKLYKSMLGPMESSGLTLLSGSTELLWITGFKATVVQESGSQLEQEYICHSNLRYRGPPTKLQRTLHGSMRVFTISQGQNTVRFAEGFGIPVRADKQFTIDNQLLSLNTKPGDEPFDLRFRNEVSYVRQSELQPGNEMVPLYQIEAGILASLGTDAAYFGTVEPSEEAQGASCAPGEFAAGRHSIRGDEVGQSFTYHWVLHPGHEERHTLVTSMLDVQYDTKIHFVAVHMHPFAKSMSMRDLTTGDLVFESKVRSFTDKLGLEKVEFISSPEGIPIYGDHEYELISIYDNTSSEEQDAMALVYLYLEDKRFALPEDQADPVSP